MTQQTLIAAVPLGVALIGAAAHDWRVRRIPNALTFALIAAGLAQSMMPAGTVAPTQSLLGLALGFMLTFPMFAIQAIRGGDVKLLTAIGAWLGPGMVLAVFMVEAVVGMVIVLAQAIVQGRLTILLRNSAVVGMNLAHLRDFVIDHVATTGNECRSVNKPLPYAVPVLIATALVAYATYAGR